MKCGEFGRERRVDFFRREDLGGAKGKRICLGRWDFCGAVGKRFFEERLGEIFFVMQENTAKNGEVRTFFVKPF